MIDKDAEWIVRIINSCENKFQLDASYALIDLYEGKYGRDKHFPKFYSTILDTIHARESQISVTA